MLYGLSETAYPGNPLRISSTQFGEAYPSKLPLMVMTYNSQYGGNHDDALLVNNQYLDGQFNIKWLHENLHKTDLHLQTQEADLVFLLLDWIDIVK